MRSTPRSFGILAAAALAACSGGGSGGGGSQCVDACGGAGATRCSGAQVERCAADAGGCLAWAAPVACATGLGCDAGLGACAGRVTLSWSANRERAVNRAGGGYEVVVSGQAPVTVPFVSGPGSPTSVQVRVLPGSHTATVRAFAALDPQGGSTRTFSAASQSIGFSVP